MQAEAPVIIVADDDRDDSLVLITALLSLKQELTVIAVSNGEELIHMLRRVSPEFIFLDINMPKKNGFEALKFIRSNNTLDQSIVIMCSTSSSTNDLRMSQELGADLYITKTTTVKSFNKMIEEIFKRDWTGKKTETVPGGLALLHVQ